MSINKKHHIYEWNSLIKEAQVRCKYALEEELEAYLCFMLMEYFQDKTLLDSAIGEQFIQSINLSGSTQKHQLKTLGDKCLLITGLFPGQIMRRSVSSNYFSHLGQTSYDQLAHLETTQLDTLYHNLAKDFYFLTEVLLALRPNDIHHPLQDNPQLAYNIWQETKSEYMQQFFIVH